MDGDHTWSVLSYNCFIGSPLPWMLARDRVFTPCLEGSARLEAQLEKVVAVGADIVALQEALSDGVAAAYTARFAAAGYDVVVGRQTSLRGIAAAHTVLLLCGAAAWACLVAWHAAVAAVGAPPLGWAAQAIAAAAGYTFACAWFYGTTMMHFLTTSVHGGLLTAYKRDAFALRGAWTRSFREQRGDLLNLWRPRAFQCLVLEPLRGVHGGGEHAVCVVNVHMNLGGDGAREAQLEDALAWASGSCVAAAARGLPTSLLVVGDTNALDGSRSMRRMTAPADDGGLGLVDVWSAAGAAAGSAAGHTWSAANPLTRGFELEPDGRLDWVFLRAAPLPVTAAAMGAPPYSSPYPQQHQRLLHAVAPVAARVAMAEPPYLSDHFAVHATFVAQTPGALASQRRLIALPPAAAAPTLAVAALPSAAVLTPLRLGCVSRAALLQGTSSAGPRAGGWSRASVASTASDASSLSIESGTSDELAAEGLAAAQWQLRRGQQRRGPGSKRRRRYAAQASPPPPMPTPPSAASASAAGPAARSRLGSAWSDEWSPPSGRDDSSRSRSRSSSGSWERPRAPSRAGDATAARPRSLSAASFGSRASSAAFSPSAASEAARESTDDVRWRLA